LNHLQQKDTVFDAGIHDLHAVANQREPSLQVPLVVLSDDVQVDEGSTATGVVPEEEDQFILAIVIEIAGQTQVVEKAAK